MFLIIQSGLVSSWVRAMESEAEYLGFVVQEYQEIRHCKPRSKKRKRMRNNYVIIYASNRDQGSRQGLKFESSQNGIVGQAKLELPYNESAMESESEYLGVVVQE